MKQYLYKLSLKPALLDEENWTDREHHIIQQHFDMLQRLLEEGKMLLAGRTLNMDSSGFGIVILEVASEDEAKKIMQDDPAVKEKIMTAELFPYRVALYRNK
ncbi:YciI family protein [Bacillus sp. SM2101]|uniref:YciI family protein n=1 Tax=Bacillus sp. SM2101 TaxID=2805366 RepID=UPI00331E9F06